MTLTYPILVLDMHQACNQSCSYCVSDSGPTRSFGKSSQIQKIVPFLERQPQWNVLLTGGEPLITPNLEEILKVLLPHGQVSLQTNLKTGIMRFVTVVPPEKTGWILATLHSCALPQADTFISNMGWLRYQRYPAVAKLILDTPMLEHFDTICDEFIEYNVPYILAPEVSFPDANARVYPPDVMEKINRYITLEASRVYFQNGFASKGRPCRAGSRLFYGRLDNGKVVGCCHGYPPAMGNLWKGKLSPAGGEVICRLDRCMCDFHWYAGIVDGYTSDEWEALIRCSQ